MIKINLGCGKNIQEGWECYDMFPLDDSVGHLDLNRLPLPIKSNYADYILLDHVYEHLNVNRQEFMKEIYRILKVGGIVEIRCPSYNPNVSHTIWFIPLGYFDGLCRIGKQNIKYANYLFEKVECYRHNTDKYGFLFRMFPVMEKLFPHMTSGECVWKLRKIKLEIKSLEELKNGRKNERINSR